MKNKIETVIIEDVESLQMALEVYDLKPTSSFQKLCKCISERAKESKVDTILIKIEKDILPSSYAAVPAMFNQTMIAHNPYKIGQAYSEGNFLVFRASNKKRPTTFRMRAVKGINRNGFFKAPRTLIPKSYRIRPKIFGKILEEETLSKIATIAKKTSIAWRVVDKNSKID